MSQIFQQIPRVAWGSLCW